MLASSSTRQQPISYTISTRTITIRPVDQTYAGRTPGNSCCTDAAGNIYTFGTGSFSQFPSFVRTTPGGSTDVVGAYYFDTGILGFAVAGDGSIFFAWNYFAASSNKIMKIPPYDGSIRTPSNLFNLANSQSIYNIAVNSDGTKVYLQYGSALNAYSNWNGVTASSTAVLGLGGVPYGLSVDRTGNICASSANGFSYVSAAGSNYSLTATVPQSNPPGYSGASNASSIVLDADAQPLFFSGNTLYKGTMAGASIQLSTSNIGTTIYGVYVNPATDVISAMTALGTSNATFTDYTPSY